ncbi:MAG TPA: hypothetical protein VFB80_14295 [Pirellulaceae bacterium]|nr:hypothetical protein [Pirellulaceae bacterium]
MAVAAPNGTILQIAYQCTQFSRGILKRRKSASGRTDSSGQYTLTTYFSPDDQPAGAMPGEYVVTVTKIDEPEGIVDPYKKGQMPKNQLPDKYSSQRSPLSATVTAGGANRFDFPLED